MGRRQQIRTGTGSAGFTLLELMVAIVIIALLMGMGVGGYDRMKRQARSLQCTGKLRHLGASLNLYLGDHNLIMPTLAAGRDDIDDDEFPTLDTILMKYVNSDEAFHCPSDHQDLWEETGSSYFWNSLINGQPMGNMAFLGMTKNQTGIPLISDKENFHKSVGDEVNILYADGHVASELQFTVDP